MLPRYRLLDGAWGLFAVANLGAMLLWPSWETIPFHFIWVSLTLLYGFRVWPLSPTLGVLGAVCFVTGDFILEDIHSGAQVAGELTEVPLMSAMFLAKRSPRAGLRCLRARSRSSTTSRTSCARPLLSRVAISSC